MKLELKKVVRNSEIKSQGNFWAAIQILEEQYDCQKYPMCRLYTVVSKNLSDENILRSTHTVFMALGTNCKIYKKQERME